MKVCVLSGGGAKGAFQVGVLKQLMVDGGQTFDAFYGTSVGALNSAAMGYVPVQTLENFWTGIKGISDAMSFNYFTFLWSQGFYNFKPLRKILSNMVLGHTPRFPSTACRVDVVSGAIQYVRNTDVQPADYIDAVLGSASIPVILEPVAGCVDGGVRQQTPLSKAIHDGADEIVAILCNPYEENPDPVPMPTGFLSSLFIGTRALDIMEHQVFISDIRKCIACNQDPSKKKINLTVYAPTQTLYDTLSFDPMKIQAAIQIGYLSQPITV